MRSEVGEWLATCVGSPISILLLSWSLLIYQNQPSPTKRRIDVLTVAVLAQSLVHQLGLLLFAILTLIRPTNHFGEFCSTLVWTLNSSSILQELTLTTIAVFAALTVRDEGPTIKKHHLKYHLVSLTVISACIGVTGILNFEPDACVFLAQDISPKYGLFFNGLRCVLVVATVLSLLTALCRASCRPSPKAELLKSVSDLSEASSKNSFECQHHHHNNQQHQQHQQQQPWDQPSSGSCTSGSTNSRACLKRRRSSVIQVDESSGWPTVYSILFVCYVFEHLPLLIVSLRPDVLKDFCTPQNLATWLPLLKDTLLPVFLAIFDKMFCRYVAKVYTKQDTKARLTHGGVDGKFRHFEQDNEYKLQLNLNHGLKFPVNGCGGGGNVGSLYGRLHNNHQTTRGRNGTMLLGIHQYGRSVMSCGDNTYASIAPETSSYASSNFGSRQHLDSTKSPKMHHQQLPMMRANLSRANSTNTGQCVQRQQEFGYDLRRKVANGSGDVFGQKVESLMQLEDQSYGYGPRRLKHFAKSLDEIREETPRRNARSVMGHHEDRPYNPPPGILQVHNGRANAAALRRNQSFDLHPRAYPRIELPLVTSRTYDIKRELALKRSLQLFEQTRRNTEYEEDEDEEGTGYETSDDESCDVGSDQQDFDTMSSCRSRARSCCSVTTVANDDFEFFQRKNTKELQSQAPRPLESKGSMRSFTPRIIEVNHLEVTSSNNNNNCSKVGGNSKPIIQSFQLKKKMSPGYSLNDLDKFNNATQAKVQLPTLSIESLKSILKSSDVSYLDSGEICRHDLGGSAPDFKKIFVTEFI